MGKQGKFSWRCIILKVPWVFKNKKKKTMANTHCLIKVNYDILYCCIKRFVLWNWSRYMWIEKKNSFTVSTHSIWCNSMTTLYEIHAAEQLELSGDVHMETAEWGICWEGEVLQILYGCNQPVHGTQKTSTGTKTQYYGVYLSSWMNIWHVVIEKLWRGNTLDNDTTWRVIVWWVYLILLQSSSLLNEPRWQNKRECCGMLGLPRKFSVLFCPYCMHTYCLTHRHTDTLAPVMGDSGGLHEARLIVFLQ